MIQNRPYKVSYLPLFEEDLEKIVDYTLFKLKNKSAALKLINDIEAAIVERSYNPNSFSPVHSKKYRKDTYYRIYIRNFTVYYVIIGNTMEVRRILYNKRNINNLI